MDFELLLGNSATPSTPLDPTQGPSLLTASAYGDGGLLLGVTSRAPWYLVETSTLTPDCDQKLRGKFQNKKFRAAFSMVEHL